jgi:prepilin-type N-terminal cleavage/methylation domain-containing protein
MDRDASAVKLPFIRCIYTLRLCVVFLPQPKRYCFLHLAAPQRLGAKNHRAAFDCRRTPTYLLLTAEIHPSGSWFRTASTQEAAQQPARRACDKARGQNGDRRTGAAHHIVFPRRGSSRMNFSKPNRNKKRSAFTLVEILIVVVIMAILAATIIPQFTDSTKDAKSSTGKFNLHTLRSQIQLYRAHHEGTAPGDDLLELMDTTDVD